MSALDLVFVQRRTGDRVYFEVMGYWSREAVFRQVDLVERGLRHKVIFAVSERLCAASDPAAPESSGAPC